MGNVSRIAPWARTHGGLCDNRASPTADVSASGLASIAGARDRIGDALFPSLQDPWSLAQMIGKTLRLPQERWPPCQGGCRRIIQRRNRRLRLSLRPQGQVAQRRMCRVRNDGDIKRVHLCIDAGGDAGLSSNENPSSPERRQRESRGRRTRDFLSTAPPRRSQWRIM